MNNKNNKEEFHMTTRRVYNFRSGAFESDYSNRQEVIKVMKDIVDGHTPAEVEEKAITVERVDEIATEIANQQNAPSPPDE